MGISSFEILCLLTFLIAIVIPFLVGMWHGKHLAEKYSARYGYSESEEEDAFFYTAMWMDD